MAIPEYREEFILLDIEHGALGVGGVLVLGGVTDEALLIGEGNVGRSDTVSLVVDENLNLSVLHHTNTTVMRLVRCQLSNLEALESQDIRVGGSQIDTNNVAIVLRGGLLLSVGGVSKEGQGGDKNEEKVEDGGPGEGLGRAIACGYASHCEECVYVESNQCSDKEVKLCRALLEETQSVSLITLLLVDVRERGPGRSECENG